MTAFAHRRFATSVGALLSILLAGQTAAVTWNLPFRVGVGSARDLAILGAVDAAAAYTVVVGPDEWSPLDLYVRRRRMETGGTRPVWSAASLVATDVDPITGDGGPQIAGDGLNVDLVYTDRFRRMVYMRSTDGGYTFPIVKRFTTRKAACVTSPLVARYAGTVVVAWDGFCGPTRVRVSTDGGATFGPTKTFLFAVQDVAVTKSTVYVTGLRGSSLVIHRSFDYGANWTRARLLAANAHLWYFRDGGGNLAAEQDRVYVTWVAGDPDDDGAMPWVRYIRSLDGGASWGPVRNLDPTSPATGGSFNPILDLKDGVARAVWVRCNDAECFSDNESLHYSQSTKAGWTPVDEIPGRGWPAGLGSVERIIVLYDGACADATSCALVRTGVP